MEKPAFLNKSEPSAFFEDIAVAVSRTIITECQQNEAHLACVSTVAAG